jgi:hypothetical protein
LEARQARSQSRFGGSATRVLREEPAERNRGYARARTRLRRAPYVDDELPLRLAAVASVSAGAHQPEGARRGGKEATEVACADRDEGASEAQAPEEDLARQVETRHARPLQRCGAVGCSADTHLKMLQDAGTRRWAKSHSGGGRATQNDPDGCAQARGSVSRFHQNATAKCLNTVALRLLGCCAVCLRVGKAGMPVAPQLVRVVAAKPGGVRLEPVAEGTVGCCRLAGEQVVGERAQFVARE